MSFIIQGGSSEVDMYVKGSRIFPGAKTADGVATDVTGYDVNSFGNFAGQIWSGAARSSFHFKKTAGYADTMPTTIAGADANAGGTAGDDIPGCFLLLS